MAGTTNATFTSPDWAYYNFPSSLSPLSESMKPGMIALCTFSALSCIATLGLLGFLAYRFIAGRNQPNPLYNNQYMLLIFQLVLADFQCDFGFFLDVMWLHKNQILAPSAGCFLQAWLINIGDLGSGFFVFAIACHTFCNVVLGKRIGLTALLSSIIALWALTLLLTVMPIALHHKDIFVVQGNWCSINAKYDVLRLYFHYIWVFIAEGVVLIMYGTTFIVMRKRMGTAMPQLTQSTGLNTPIPIVNANKNRNTAQAKVSRATTYMIIYPLIYVLTTLPLAAGRIASMSGRTLTSHYLVGAGTLMACGGWMNVLLYSLTRRIFLSEKPVVYRQSRMGTKKDGDRTGIEMMNTGKGSPYDELPSPGASTDDIVKGGADKEEVREKRMSQGVVMQTTWDVKVEEVMGLESAKRGDALGCRTFVTY